MKSASRSLLPQVRLIAAIAADAVMGFYGRTDHVTKADGSPVTAADEASERIILAGLRHLAPEIPIVSEERHAAEGGTAHGGVFWLVDPLDGTKEFLSGNGEFTVNIALIVDGAPVLGVVAAPALDEIYEAAGAGTAALISGGERRAITVRVPPPEGITVVGSRSHADPAAMERFLGATTVAAFRPAGSSLKLCLVARGEADLYPRLGTTMEWDIAAGQAVVEAAGGAVLCLDGQALRHGKPGHRNPHFAAWGQAPRPAAAPML